VRGDGISFTGIGELSRLTNEKLLEIYKNQPEIMAKQQLAEDASR
jgi:hypothetical protein